MRLTARLAFALAIVGAGCVDVETDPGEGPGDLPPLDGPTVEFDPGNSIIPFPNNLVRDRTTGKVNLPQQCNESPAQTQLRTQVLNTLDGFGTFKVALRFTATEPVDMASLSEHIVLYARDPAGSAAIPVVAFPSMTSRFSADCATPSVVDSVVIVPRVPLQQKTTYVVGVTAGLRTMGGEDFVPSSTWALVRQATNPVTVDQQGNIVAERTPLDATEDAQTLLGLNLLWNAHAQGMAFLADKGVPNDSVLLGWEFTTQTTTDQLDPMATGSPASEIATTPLTGITSVIPGGTPIDAFFCTQVFGLAYPSPECTATCNQVGCANVADVVRGFVSAKDYQTRITGGLNPVPGPWNDPVHPTNPMDAVLVALAVYPTGAAPANGWPTIVFGHGLGSSKESLLAIASQLATAGFASVAIDFVAHGDPARGGRAVQISNDAAIGCDGTVRPSTHPQCFAQILSSNLATTRDNIRQTVVDLQRTIAAARACGTTMCGPLRIDETKVGYMGISLGGIIGTMVNAEANPQLASGVTNVAAVGWVDIIENTLTPQIKCPLVDSLIDAGVITGDKWNPVAMTGICLTDEWKTQPGYQTFAAAARWILDPGDGANFTGKLATRLTLLQEVIPNPAITDNIGDAVVPNVATDQLGALTGRMPAEADMFTGTEGPSAPLLTMPTQSKWLTYKDLPAGGPFPGNDFHHASLLRPSQTGTVPATVAERLGTGRVQTDAIGFLSITICGGACRVP